MPKLEIQTIPPCPGRTLIIGDVHGCAEELEKLLEAFGPDEGDCILAVGDLINRGPDSPGVLDLARANGIRSILGNHELRLLRARQENNPGLLKAKDRATFARMREADWQWIESWPHIFRIPGLNTLVVHGGFAPDKAWEQQDPWVVLHIQVLDAAGQPARRAEAADGRPWAASWRGPEHVVYGHTPRPQPLQHPFATGLDTGCVYGYTLTALSLPERRFYRIEARRAYADD